MDTYAQAVDVARRTGGPESYFYREIAVKYAYQLVKAGRYAQARDLLEPLLPTLHAHASTGMEAVAYAYGLTTFAIIKMENDHDPAAALKLLDQARQALGAQAGEFLSVYAFISQYTMRAHVALHQAGAAQKALDDYQSLLDAKKEPLESPSRKDLAKLRGELTNAGAQAAAQ
jgi:serine/threonine-protein kinase